MALMYDASPDLVFEALQRAVVASGATLQGSDPRNRTVFFTRGKRNRSAGVQTGPQGSYLVGSSEGLDAFMSVELAKTQQPPAPAEAPGTRATTDLASELERLGNLRERNLLTEDEFAAAKARAFEQAGPPTTLSKPSEQPAEPSPRPPTVSEREASGEDIPPVSASATTPVATPPAGTSRSGSWLATWHGLSRRKQIVIAVVVVLVALAALGALIPSEGGGDEPAVSPTPSASTGSSGSEGNEAPPSAGEVSPQVTTWADDVVEWSEQQADAFSDLGALLQDDSFNTRLLLGDQDAVIEVAIPLAVMQQCTNNFPDPPAANAQARKVANLVYQACAEFERSADQFSRGVDNNNVQLIASANTAMLRGTEILEDATTEVERLRRSSG